MDRVCKYILNQKENHRKKTFEEEFMKMLQQFEIEIGKKQLFDFFVEDVTWRTYDFSEVDEPIKPKFYKQMISRPPP